MLYRILRVSLNCSLSWTSLSEGNSERWSLLDTHLVKVIVCKCLPFHASGRICFSTSNVLNFQTCITSSSKHAKIFQLTGMNPICSKKYINYYKDFETKPTSYAIICGAYASHICGISCATLQTYVFKSIWIIF